MAINLIVSPDWDTKQFALVRKWALSVPEIVNLTVMTPYPGTEIWHTEAQKLTSLDYRLFDIQHAVLPTKLPLDVFYQELVTTQSVLNRKHLGVAAVAQTFGIIGRNLMHGQTNFARMLWKFNKVYNAPRQHGDHQREVRYELPIPEHHEVGLKSATVVLVDAVDVLGDSVGGGLAVVLVGPCCGDRADGGHGTADEQLGVPAAGGPTRTGARLPDLRFWPRP